jgi:hypothetical protein
MFSSELVLALCVPDLISNKYNGLLMFPRISQAESQFENRYD